MPDVLTPPRPAAEAAAPQPPEQPPTAPARRNALVRALHLLVLWTFAVAQPVFDLLSRYPEFFAVKGTVGSDIVWFAVLAIVPAFVGFLVLTTVLGRISARLSNAVEGLLIAVMAAVIVMPLFKGLDVVPVLVYAVVAVIGVGALVAYRRLPVVPQLLTVLIPAPLVFAALFLLFSPVTKLVENKPLKSAKPIAGAAPTTPVLLIVFDEFPASGIMNAQREIDAERYPNFARLAKDATWYRNASSASYESLTAVPAILTSHMPRHPHRLPLASDQPDSLFSLLGGSHSVNAYETLTRLCPPTQCLQSGRGYIKHRMIGLAKDTRVIYGHIVLPRRAAEKLPQIDSSWEDFNKPKKQDGPSGAAATWEDDRERVLNEFVAGIRDTKKPELDFIHLPMPHRPYEYLANGAAYESRMPGRVQGWTEEKFLIDQAYQQFLVQVGYTDRRLGEVLDRLEKARRYDDTLVVVVADHGISFRPGGRIRNPTDDNLPDIAMVPMFVKYPQGEGAGVVDDRPVQTLDVMPTVADVLGIELPWKPDGQSLLAKDYRPVPRFMSVRKRHIPIPANIVEMQAAEARRREQTFGSEGYYDWGPNADELLGRSVDDLDVASGSAGSVTIEQSDALAKVDTKSGYLPAYLSGEVRAEAGDGPRNIAVALDGEVVSVAGTFIRRGDELHSVMLPPEALRNGRNEPVFYEVRGEPGSLELVAFEADLS